jgi:tetratricopeptide (TPR) repeat protein
VPRWFTEGLAVHEETAVSPDWGDRLSPDVIMAIKNKKLLPVTELDRGFVHPTTPAQVIVSYFQAGQICDFINQKWNWDTLLAMLHDFASGTDTAVVIRKELKIEPADFDKQFLEYVEAGTRTQVSGFEDWRKGVKGLVDLVNTKDWGAVIKEGTVLRDKYPDYVESHSVYEMLAQAYTAKDDKPAAIAELLRYEKIGGRSPATLKQLSKMLEEAGRTAEAAEVLNRLNYIYPMDADAHRSLGSLWLVQEKPKEAIREFQAVLAKKPMDQAQAHYDLARAFRANNQIEQAKDECLSALEAAPGFRPAQKLLLELSNSQEPAALPVKK